MEMGAGVSVLGGQKQRFRIDPRDCLGCSASGFEAVAPRLA